MGLSKRLYQDLQEQKLWHAHNCTIRGHRADDGVIEQYCEEHKVDVSGVLEEEYYGQEQQAQQEEVSQ